jgi:hypothetical protein
MGAPDEPRCQSEWRLRAKALIARLTAELSEDATVEERRKTLWAKVGQRIMALFGAGRYGAKRCANTLHAMATSAPIQPTRSFNGRTMSTSRSGRAAKMRKAPTIEFRTIDAAAKSGASFLVKRGQDMALARWAGDAWVYPATSGRSIDFEPEAYYDPSWRSAGAVVRG